MLGDDTLYIKKLPRMTTASTTFQLRVYLHLHRPITCTNLRRVIPFIEIKLQRDRRQATP